MAFEDKPDDLTQYRFTVGLTMADYKSINKGTTFLTLYGEFIDLEGNVQNTATMNMILTI